MNVNAQILKVLNMIIDRRVKGKVFYTKKGIVVSVDETKRNCVVTVDGFDYPDVSLQSIQSATKGIVVIPTVASQVYVTFGLDNLMYISLFSTIDKILIDTDLVQFNGGTLNGMVKVDSNVSQLNKIEQDINNLKTAFTNWLVTPNDGGGALKTAAASWSGTQLTKTVKGDIENTKIKQ